MLVVFVGLMLGGVLAVVMTRQALLGPPSIEDLRAELRARRART